MLYCNLQVLLCAEIVVQEDFAPPKYDLWRDGAKKFSVLAIARHILCPQHKIWYNLTTAPDHLSGLPIPHPSWRHRHLNSRRRRCLEARAWSSHFSDPSYAPGWAQASHHINPALHSNSRPGEAALRGPSALADILMWSRHYYTNTA